MARRALLLLAVVLTAACGGDGPAPAFVATDWSPAAVGDEFEVGYGLWDCEGYLAPLDPFDAETGIDSERPGFIRVAPTEAASAGDRATIGRFLAGARIELTDSRVGFGDERTRSTGDDCFGRDGELLVLVWADPSGAPALIRRTDLADTLLAPDGGVIVVAFAKPNDIIPLPPWLGGPPSPTATVAETTTTTTEPAVPPSIPEGRSGLEIRAVTGAGPGTCTINQFRLDGECLGVGAPVVSRDGVVEIDVVERDDGTFAVNLVLSEPAVGALNTIADPCSRRIEPCSTGQFVLIVDNTAVIRQEINQRSFEADELLVGSFTAAQAERLAATIEATD